MPYVGGPRESRRKLLCSVIHSVLLYGAFVWGPSLEWSKQRAEKLLMVQRRAILRCICAYNTTLRVAVNIISATPPIDLLAKERADAYWCRKKEGILPSRSSLRSTTIRRWVRQLKDEEDGEWTQTLISDVAAWCLRGHGKMSYHLTQLLSGHGCFGVYLHKIEKEHASPLRGSRG